MFRIFDQLPKDEESLKRHVAALEQIAKSKEHQDLFSHLYSCLSILDSKSQSLLSFNALVIAVFAIFVARSANEWLAVGLGLTSVLASSFLLMSVVWVHWSTSENLEKPASHGLTLLRVRRTRTIRYRIAWLLSTFALAVLTIFLAMKVVALAIG